MTNYQKLLELYKYLLEYSDDSHKLSSTDIFNHFLELGSSIENKTLKSMITFLTDDCNIDIHYERGKNALYYIGDRQFEISEMKVLLDSLSSIYSISPASTKSIQRKILSGFSEYQRDTFIKSYSEYSINKTKKNYTYTLDFLIQAINERHSIKFTYMKFDLKKGRIPKSTEPYNICPYKTVLNNGRHYLIGFSYEHNSTRTYRIDKIENAEFSEKKFHEYEGNINDYINEEFQMYSGDPISVAIEFDKNLSDQVYDKFGIQSLEILSQTADKIKCKVVTHSSPTFYAWVFSFSGRIKILGPDRPIKEFYEMIKSFTK